MSSINKNEVLNGYINDFKHEAFDLFSFFNDNRYYEIWEFVYSELEEYNKYILDGRRDDVFYEVLKGIKDNNFWDINLDSFVLMILSEIKKYDIDNCLILPLNGIEKNMLPNVLEFDNPDIKIFSVKEGNIRKRYDKTLIADYYKKRMGEKLNMQHMMFKDKDMFKTPVLTAIIKGQNDNEIYHSAQEISQGLYAIIRINDLLFGHKKRAWHGYQWPEYPKSYAVYSKEGTGHQMKLFCSPILDVDTKIFIKYSGEIINTFNLLMKTYFEAPISLDNDIYQAKQRWLNSMQMFNTAYDLASIERFDSSLVTLLSFLESLFLNKNSRQKKEDLQRQVSLYVERDVSELLDNSYRRRNRYLHDGVRVGGTAKFKLVEKIHNYVPGYRPFAQYSFWGLPKEIDDLKSLMKLCADIVIRMIISKDFVVGQNKSIENIVATNEVDILNILEESIEMSEDEKAVFDKYVRIRGIGVYFDTVSSLKLYDDENEKIKFDDFMGLIRYDKNLRDVLYKMLGSYEEKIKNILYSNFDLVGSKFLMRVTEKNIKRIEYIDTSDNYGWNLMRKSKLDLGSINYIFKHYDFLFDSNSDDFFSDLDNVRELRNIIMHHKMLLIDQESEVYDKTLIDVRVSKITRYIKSLYNLLDEGQAKGLITAVNKARWDVNRKFYKSRFIYIEHLEGGYDELQKQEGM
jgi:hypothetical protein